MKGAGSTSSGVEPPLVRRPSLPFLSLKLGGKRKIKKPCPICGAARILCLCDVVPRIELRTRICLLIHHRELSRNSNTGLLALRALVNSEMRIRGEGRESLNLKNLLTPAYRTYLFFPSSDAVELDEALVAQERTPMQLIVPDGTWRQASKTYLRCPELRKLTRVKIGTAGDSSFQLRTQSRPEGMATLQAIAYALGVIEGNQVRAELMKLYHAKIERALIGRGILRKSHP